MPFCWAKKSVDETPRAWQDPAAAYCWDKQGARQQGPAVTSPQARTSPHQAVHLGPLKITCKPVFFWRIILLCGDVPVYQKHRLFPKSFLAHCKQLHLMSQPFTHSLLVIFPFPASAQPPRPPFPGYKGLSFLHLSKLLLRRGIWGMHILFFLILYLPHIPLFLNQAVNKNTDHCSQN